MIKDQVLFGGLVSYALVVNYSKFWKKAVRLLTRVLNVVSASGLWVVCWWAAEKAVGL